MLDTHLSIDLKLFPKFSAGLYVTCGKFPERFVCFALVLFLVRISWCRDLRGVREYLDAITKANERFSASAFGAMGEYKVTRFVTPEHSTSKAVN